VSSELVITEQEIAMLVDRFYAKVRLDPEIGPVFLNKVQNWDAHLALLKEFWSTVLLSNGLYRGNPLLAHLPLKIEEPHFTRWLQLFSETAYEVLPPAYAARVTQKANLIAMNLKRFLASGVRSFGDS
jgi:hemoglobin